MDELVKRLREIHPEEFGDAWDFTFACQQTMHEAADAIEELSRDLDSMNEANIALYGALPKWIPVSEKLPEESGHYLICLECKCNGESLGAWMQMAWFCEKFYWEHRYGDGIFNETVTHWMPLPEPPKEGK